MINKGTHKNQLLVLQERISRYRKKNQEYRRNILSIRKTYKNACENYLMEINELRERLAKYEKPSFK